MNLNETRINLTNELISKIEKKLRNVPITHDQLGELLHEVCTTVDSTFEPIQATFRCTRLHTEYNGG